MSKKVAVILSGCGGLDGAEIGEGICSLLAIERAGFEWKAFSLNEDQACVMNHTNGQVVDEKRNMMVEAARIVHGKISEVKNIKVSDFDILWFVGGFGVVRSFSDLLVKGPEGTVHSEIEALIKDFHSAQKPIVGVCAAPLMIGRALKGEEVTLSSGAQPDAIKFLGFLGHKAEQVKSDKIVIDEKAKIYTTPAYMNDDAKVSMILEALDKISAHLKESCQI